MSGRKVFDKIRNERYIRDEFSRANNYISMFNHAALQGGEEFRNRINEIDRPPLIIHGTDDKIWHFKNADILLEKIKGFEDWDSFIDEIAKHIKDAKG